MEKNDVNEYFCNLCLNKNSIKPEQLEWPRDLLNCIHCKSIVRNRSLYLTLLVNSPNYNCKKIHHSSPCYNDALHLKLLKECKDYSYSQYFTDIPNGEFNKDNIQCADLSNLPFEDNSFDIFLTSDVFEHLWEPKKCLNEIFRVLKPNGIYLMVFPMDNGYNKTEQPVIKKSDGFIKHLETICGTWKGYKESPEYHGNPADSSGSIVTYYWGYDVKQFIENNSNFKAEIFFKHDIEQFGIICVMNEAVICKKQIYFEYDKNDISETKKIYYSNLDLVM
jgi:SAM-dependent methyltransferase